MNESVIQQVRTRNPLIHNLTNEVVMNFTANGLLAFGGSPIMAKAEEEAGEMASIADGVLINIGTSTLTELPAMKLAGKAANKKGVPVVLDPVGIGATSFRKDVVKQLLQEVQFTAIKGNAGEMAKLVDIPWEVKGVESVGDGDGKEIAAKVSEMYRTTAVVTGETDFICNEGNVIQNTTGHRYLEKITGAGCLLGSILTACLTTEAPIEDQAFAAVYFYGLAAEYAAAQGHVHGSGSFLPAFIDALSRSVDQLNGV
ncbi:hydroxyethylthiazole kinase [Virgibacillus pantothenticus]|uniref:Hydroxyethylthiazole kinase n=1 Tax=Virgibacillus pantothenticus TaxID=1473 RepID=A0A0L0QK48_VIRPA|nr:MULTISPECIES: hydroxyethylthiazole kinase [Virgibacillus]API92806.1 hydroxyethylthiazole kinase [Virgibacillus sp. 6R]KNE18957.1 hydroxyethylthiazole kinase [Virgibacillus pantothenticus]MBS7428315.1 hydroxyethylthiazole kinase [Virgibacillus sp. 19R1-5]MBU8565252.1 hydroxyethylthiazole kinase [Virgibacillus pantothenticus]MBU8599529.1 hydroxyethylthiazole kinase [Virgibacillus pantothenticus]